MHLNLNFAITIKWCAILLAITLYSCKKQDLKPIPINDSTVRVSTTVPITVMINQSLPGYAIPPGFEGLSYETGIFGETPDFLNENNAVLIQLIKNLGKGVLRIGGNSSDQVLWTGNARTANTATNLLTTTDVDHLAAFSKAIGWPVIFGLNLGNFNADTAANEALYVQNSLQNNLYVLQSGNEPDVFNLGLRKPSYGYNGYRAEWNAYFTAVKNLVPSVRFAGPDVDPFNPAWISSFASDEHKNIRLLDGHYYDVGPASNPAITYTDILAPNPKLDSYLLQLNKISIKNRFPFRISECNSVFGGGKPGVSDVFASALWALDFMWDVAENGGQGVNFHGGAPRFAYTPITMQNGTVTARPEYYAMLAFKYATNGAKIIPATIFDPRNFNNCGVYACANADGSYAITLINKDVKNFAFTVQLSKTASTIDVARLRAPSITSTTGTTFAGKSISADGTFTPSVTPKIINDDSFVITVPAGSAAVVMVN